jgi:hypothetical protein
MKRLSCLIFCILLLAAFGPAGMYAQSAAPIQASTAKADTAKAKPRKAASAKPSKAKARADRQAAEALLKKSPLSREALTKPYTKDMPFGPPAPARQSEDDNATSLDFDPTPQARPFAKPKEDPAVSLHFGGETVIDPLTKKEVTRQPDSSSSKNGADLKGALDKVGGKAEIKVDILKF